MLTIKLHLAVENSYSIFFFSESPVSTCNLRTFSSFLQGDESYEHWDVYWNTNILCVTLKPLQHPKELGYFFILEPKQVTLQTPGGEDSTTQWCAGCKGSVFSLWAHYPWLPPFLTKHATREISKGNLDVKPCVCSQAQECTEGKAPSKALQIFLISLPPGAD